MRGKQITDLHIQQRSPQEPTFKGWVPWLWRTVWGGVFLLGALGLLTSGFSDSLKYRPLLWAFGLAGYGLFSAVCATKWGKLLPVIALPACLLCGFVWAVPLRSGLADMANELLRFWSGKTGQILLLYESQGGGTTAGLFLTGLLALLTAWGAHRRLWLMLFPLVALAIGWGIGFFVGGMQTLLLILGFTAVALQNAGVCWRRTVLATGLFALIWALSLPLSSSLLQAGERTRTWLNEFWHQLRYDSATNSLPEGDLQNLGAWEKSQAPALKLTMEQPQKLYLRGFVGQTYTGCSWQTAAADVTTESAADLFYWLHKDGFYAQTELAAAVASTKTDCRAGLELENLGACRKWAYLPYGLASTDCLNAFSYPDAGTVAKARNDTVDYQPGGLLEWYMAQKALSDGAVKDQRAEDFQKLESAYRTFVYSAYLTLPEEAAQACQRLLGQDRGPMTLLEIRMQVKDLLQAAIRYDETTVTHNGKQDFATYVLTAGGSGYSVHYATIATLLLRACGVPARYVEGYFLSAQEAEALKPGQAVVLDECHAHAWVEYYLDGVGWVPFEVTPGYEDLEEQTLLDLLDSDQGFSQTSEKTYERQHQQVPPAPVQQPDRVVQPQDEGRRLQIWPLWGLLSLIFCLAVARTIVLRLRLRRWLQRTKTAPPRQAVEQFYACSRSMLQMAGFSWEPGELHWEAFAAQHQEALFSRHLMTDEQKSAFQAFYQQARTYYRSHVVWYRRLYLQWIRCMFI